jgi:phosphatidylglycerol:prolipoprotein diacylglycerol transferase
MLDWLYHNIDPIAFSVGSLQIHWYGIGYILGFLFAGILATRICKRWEIKLTLDGLLTIIIACVIGTILGGRFGYVLFYGNGYYFTHPAEILRAGMSFHGGLIGFVIGLIIAARIIRFPLSSLIDIAAIGVPIGLGIVRCANFINGELWGAETTLPWGVVFDDTRGGALPRHPTQLYEAILEGLVLFIILYLLSRRKPPLPRGSYAGIFGVGYATFRIAIEFVRQPDVQIGYLFGTDWITMGMTLSVPLFLVGVGFIVYAVRMKLPQSGQELAERAERAEQIEQEQPELAEQESASAVDNPSKDTNSVQ